MNQDRLKEFLDKIPVGLLLVAYLGYLAFDFYNFENDPASPFIQMKTKIISLKNESTKLEAKYKELSQFVKHLNDKKAEVRQLTQELEASKGAIPDSLDIPAIMKTTVTEARKIGLTIESLRPGGTQDQEYYSEQSFILAYHGIYAQLVIFLERLANINQIMKVDKITINSHGGFGQKFVMLDGQVELKAFKYRGTQADTLKASNSTQSDVSLPTSTPAPQQGDQSIQDIEMNQGTDSQAVKGSGP